MLKNITNITAGVIGMFCSFMAKHLKLQMISHIISSKPNNCM
jgi:hypothetical protein